MVHRIKFMTHRNILDLAIFVFNNYLLGVTNSIDFGWTACEPIYSAPPKTITLIHSTPSIISFAPSPIVTV